MTRADALDLIEPLETSPDDPRSCSWCGTGLTGRKGQRYCSNRCTVAAWRLRRRIAAQAVLEDRYCEWCSDPLPGDCRPSQLYCNAACKQAAWRAGCSMGETREERAAKWARLAGLAASITEPRNT